MIFLKLIRAIALVGLFLAGGSAWANIPEGACGTVSYDLLTLPTPWHSTQTVVGTATFANDATNLYVKFNLTAPGFALHMVSVWGGNDTTNKPDNPFQYPYLVDATGTEFTAILPLSGLSIVDADNSCPQIWVHAVAWLVDTNIKTSQYPDGVPVDAFAQAWYQLCCEEPPQISECETAFAKGGYVFTTDSKSNPEKLPSLNLTKNRWGWAINLPAGAIGTTTYQIWKGAGLNNTSKGELVGTLTVNWDGSIVTVTYNLSDDLMKELHIYAGDLKPMTTAPGQFGYTQYFDPPVAAHTASFSVADTNGDGIWLIAHAVSCEVQP